MPGWTEADDIFQLLCKVLQVAALVLVQNHKIHVDAALSQEVVREQKILSHSGLSRVVNPEEHDREVS